MGGRKPTIKFYERPLFWVCVLFSLGGFFGWAGAASLPDLDATIVAWLSFWFLYLMIHITLGLREVGYGEKALIAGEIVGFIMIARTPVLPFIPAPYDALFSGTIITATVLLSVLFHTKCIPLLQRLGNFTQQRSST